MALEAIGSITKFQNSVKPVQNVDVQATTSVQTNSSNVVASMNETTKQGFSDGKSGKEGQASEKQIKTAISEANSKIKQTSTLKSTRCEFSYHEETNRVSIKVVDKDTEEVIREIPPEETLDMIEKMWELAGILVDEKR